MELSDRRILGGSPKASLQELCEQVVEPVPPALLVQGDKEQVGPLELLQEDLAVRAPP